MVTIFYGLCIVALIFAAVALRDYFDGWRPPEPRGFDALPPAPGNGGATGPPSTDRPQPGGG